MKKTTDKTINHSLESSVKIVLNMLDEAINDYENGQLLTEDDFWKGIHEE